MGPPIEDIKNATISKRLASSTEASANVKEPTNFKNDLQRKTLPMIFDESDSGTKIDVSSCHDKLVNKILKKKPDARGLFSEATNGFTKDQIFGKDRDSQNLIHAIIKGIRRMSSDGKTKGPFHAQAFVELLTIEKPELCVSECLDGKIPFIWAIDIDISIFYKITNLLIPDDLHEVMIRHRHCGSSSVNCPLHQIAPGLRQHFAIPNDSSHDMHNSSSGKVPDSLPCLVESIKVIDIIKSIQSLKEKLKDLLQSKHNKVALQLLSSFLVSQNFDTQKNSKEETLNMQSFRALLDLCHDDVFVHRYPPNDIPLHTALCLYRDKTVDHQFLLSVVKCLVQRCPATIFEKRDDKKRTLCLPHEVEDEKGTKDTEKKEAEKKEDEKNKERLQPVLDFLKWTCIGFPTDSSKTDTEWAKLKIDFLYGNIASAKKISLNLTSNDEDKTAVLDKAYIDKVKRYAAMDFESVMAHVTLPYWDPRDCKALVNVPSESQKIQNAAITSGDDRTNNNGNVNKERNPYVHIFQWLKDSRVTKIFTIDVTDDGPRPHTDLSICRSFTTAEGRPGLFGVEVWKWKKFDLCAQTIAFAAPMVRELHLYNRGNVAVLYHWASSKALAELPNLEKVVVHIYPEHDDDSEYCKLHGQEFRADLANTCRRLQSINLDAKWEENTLGSSESIVVHINPVDKGQPQLQRDTSVADKNTSKDSTERKNTVWIKRLAGFRDFLTNFPGTSIMPIKVAILDDGVNVECFKRKFEGRSFPETGCEFFQRPCSHGTDMAQCVIDVYPLAQMCVGRLERKGDKIFNISACCDALEWAIDIGANVISMSWSFPFPDNPTKLPDDDDKKRFAALIENNKDRVLFFGSLADIPLDTATGKARYAPFSLKNVMRIGAATEFGRALSENIHACLDFLLPGVDLPDFRNHSGSSYATAYAAGLAAAMLHCIRLLRKIRLEEKPNSEKDPLGEVWEKATRKEGMMTIFDELCKANANDKKGEIGQFVLAHPTLTPRSPCISRDDYKVNLTRMVDTVYPTSLRE